MKKLLGLSILAATLASTAAFADIMGSQADVAKKLATPQASQQTASSQKLLVAKNKAAPNTLVFAQIVQNAISNSTPDNHILKADFAFDDQDNLKNGALILSDAIQPNDNEAIQAALANAVREAVSSNGAGWKFVKFVGGNNTNNIGTLYFIDQRQDNDTVKGIAIHTERTKVTFTQVKAGQAIVGELQREKKKAGLVAIKNN